MRNPIQSGDLPVQTDQDSPAGSLWTLAHLLSIRSHERTFA
jgi:hypothetical protein